MPPIGPSPIGTYLDLPIFNSIFPNEGGKTVPVILDFSQSSSYAIDLSLLQQRGYIKMVQGLYFDNSQNTQSVKIVLNGTNQVIKLPGSSQGYLPCFISGQIQFTATCAGTGVVQLLLTNLPLPAVVWGASAAFNFNASGYLQTTDVAIDAVTTASGVNIINNGTENNNFVKPVFFADELFTGNATTSAAQTIMTGNPSYFFTHFYAALSGDAALGAAGEYSITVKDGATTILQAIAQLPNAALTSDVGPIKLLDVQGIQFNSKANANTLTIAGSANLTAGKLYWNVAGGLCTNIGP